MMIATELLSSIVSCCVERAGKGGSSGQDCPPPGCGTGSHGNYQGSATTWSKRKCREQQILDRCGSYTIRTNF